MNNKKILVLIILAIFCVGMVMGTASASHTFKAGKYKITITDKQYNKIKKAQDGSWYGVTKKTGKYHKYKVPKYKTKKVTKKKWKYKTVLDNEFYYHGNDCDYYDYHTMSKYTKKGWEWCGSFYKDVNYGDGTSATKYYYKFKKKVKVTENKKVKVGYKTKKTPIKIEVGADKMQGAYVWVYANWYNNGYNQKTFASKNLNL